MSTQEQNYQKLAAIINPLLQGVAKDIKEHDTLTSQEVLIKLEKLETMLNILEKLVSDKKRPAATRGEKKAADDATPVDPDTPQQQQALPKNFAVNKLVYFRDRFKNDAAYRNKYVTNELQALMDADPTISAKTKEDQKLVAQATFCWNYFKNSAQETAAAIEKEYIAAKADHEAANRPPQQEVEARTPPAGQCTVRSRFVH